MTMQAAIPSGGEGLEEVHEVPANTTPALFVLHLAGIAFSSLSHRENLIGSMITGFKRREK
ncbi:hypothetical protein [Thiocapsa sp.]|uniref:hypothetical protein n=1 Tax=Thiocapsa sp. TaxID=2024551 RepID=UPI0035943FB2